MELKELSGGIDIGSELHHVVVFSESGEILYDKRVLHRFRAFNEVVSELKEIERRTSGKISFAIEGKNGYGAPFDRILGENGFKLYNIDNLKLKQFRNTFGAECKTDRRDAKMLARLMSLKAKLNGEGDKVFIPIKKAPVVNQKLKIFSRYQQTLIDEKKRVCNRLTKKLLEICPGIFDIFSKIDNKTLLRILVRFPNFSRYRKLTIGKLMKMEGIGKVTAEKIISHLQDLEYVDELVEVYAKIIRSQARRILALKEEIELLDKRLDKLGEQSREVQHLRTIPGVATKISSRLAGEIEDIGRFNNENKLASYFGVGCVNDDSGKRKMAKAVFKANKICKTAMIELAGCTLRRVDESRIYYEKKRKEGKNHNHALRCLARQMTKVIFKMLTEDRDYYIKDMV